MEGKAAMSQYCKAQAAINKLNKETDDARKSLTERIRTYRSLLHDELTQRRVSCLEMPVEGKEPVYVRLKSTSVTANLDQTLIADILCKISHADLSGLADKNGHDFPKMITSFFSNEVKTKHTKKRDKTTLSISNAKERGFTRTEQSDVPESVRQVASDLIKTQEELGNLRKRQNISKRPIVEEQKAVARATGGGDGGLHRHKGAPDREREVPHRR